MILDYSDVMNLIASSLTAEYKFVMPCPWFCRGSSPITPHPKHSNGICHTVSPSLSFSLPRGARCPASFNLQTCSVWAAHGRPCMPAPPATVTSSCVQRYLLSHIRFVRERRDTREFVFFATRTRLRGFVAVSDDIRCGACCSESRTRSQPYKKASTTYKYNFSIRTLRSRRLVALGR